MPQLKECENCKFLVMFKKGKPCGRRCVRGVTVDSQPPPKGFGCTFFAYNKFEKDSANCRIKYLLATKGMNLKTKQVAELLPDIKKSSIGVVLTNIKNDWLETDDGPQRVRLNCLTDLDEILTLFARKD